MQGLKGLLLAMLICTWAPPLTAQTTASPDGTIHIQNAEVPASRILSEAAKESLKVTPLTEGPGAPPLPAAPDMATTRRLLEERLGPKLRHMREIFPVDVEETTIDGVSAAIVTPRDGIPASNRNRVIINAPGGGFFLGNRANGLLISIPIAAEGRFKVITITYRQGPEFQFPAATEDFTKVYRAMLKSHRPTQIGLVACSAGGTLVAEATAAFQKLGLPAPGVLGIYCSGANPKWMQGDSASFFQLLMPLRPVAGGASPNIDGAYFGSRDLNDAAISPDVDLAVLAKFPPTLFVSGTRDMAMSQAAYSHRRLLQAGAQSQLLIYDGLAHGFMTNPDLPESRELYKLAAKFYDAHLSH